jgi:hypothetical protein
LIFVLQLYFFSFFVVVDVICENLPDTYVDKLLNYLSGGIEFTPEYREKTTDKTPINLLLLRLCESECCLFLSNQFFLATASYFS